MDKKKTEILITVCLLIIFVGAVASGAKAMLKKKQGEKGDASVFSVSANDKKQKRPLFPLLVQPQELDLLKALAIFPGVIASCAESLEPCGLVSYLQALANKFHHFYDKQRVITEDVDLTEARLALIGVTMTVLATGLGLLGVSAPDKM